MSTLFSNIIQQSKSNVFSYNNNTVQQIHLKLISCNMKGKYSNSMFFSQFIDFLIEHIFNQNLSIETENKLNQLNIPMVYMVYVLKTYEYPEFDNDKVFNTNYDKYWKELFNDIMTFCDDYSLYRMDLLRYLYIYNLINENKYNLI